MYYVKCGLNRSLLTYFWLLQKVCGTLDHCSVTTYTIHNAGWFTCLLWCDIPWNKASRAGPRHIWRTIHCSVSLAARWTQTAVEFGRWFCQCWLWRLLSRITFVTAVLVLGVGRSWLFLASSIKFLTRRSLKSQWVYLAPFEDNRIQLLSTIRSRRWKNNFMAHQKLRQLIE